MSGRIEDSAWGSDSDSTAKCFSSRHLARGRSATGAARSALYRELLAVDPNSVELHERLAPLLAATRQEFDAWNSYRVVAHAALREGREDRAIAVFREAAAVLPRRDPGWQGLARLLVRQSEPDAAIEVLLEGSRQFRATSTARRRSISCAARARSTRGTSRPCSSSRCISAAPISRPRRRFLLEGLAERCQERQLRRVRARRSRSRPARARSCAGSRAGAGARSACSSCPRPTALAQRARAHARAANPAPAGRRDARVVNPVPESEDDRSSAAF
jgi:tetratricopeptide (TPR) repeat protein